MPKFEQNERVTEFIAEVEKLDYRSVIEHGDVMRALGCVSKSRSYYAHICQANKVLAEKGKLLRVITNVGYEVVHPDEWIDEAGEHVRRAGKAVKRADRICEFAPVEKMSKTGLNRFRNVNDRVRALAVLVKKEKRNVFDMLETTRSGNRTFERLPPPKS